MSKACSGIIVILLIVIAGGIYKYLPRGGTPDVGDGRRTIHLNPDERDFIVTEMQLFLTVIRQITKGIAEKDMRAVAESARMAGNAAQGGMPETIREKLPTRFKQLGSDTHTAFDLLALDSEALEDTDHTLSQLSALLQNCNVCHSAYRIGRADS